MKTAIKIECLILFLLCSFAVYLHYSFNVANILMENNTKIDYTFKRDIDNSTFIDKINKIATNRNVYIYYSTEGHDKVFYVTDNFKMSNRTISNFGNNKEIKLPSTYRKINIFHFSGAKGVIFERGSLVIEGNSENVKLALSDLTSMGMNINNFDTVKLEDSNFIIDFLPMLTIVLILLSITISFDILKKNKKMSILFLEGYSRFEIILGNLKTYLMQVKYILPLIISFIIIIAIVLKNDGFISLYLPYIGTLFGVTTLIITTLNIFLVKKFSISKLKNVVNIDIPLILLYTFKIVSIFIVLISSVNISIYYQKLNIQQDQLVYNKKLENYYGYDIKDDGFFSSETALNATPYEKFYLDTMTTKDGLLTTSNTCSIEAIDESESCGNSNSHFIVSPYYISMINENINVNSLTKGIKVYTPNNKPVTKEKIREIYSIRDSADIDINPVDVSSVPIIDSDYQVTNMDFNSLIVLNDDLIHESSTIQDNFLYYIQSYILKLTSEDKYAEIKNYLIQYGLTEQITDIKSVTSTKISYVTSLINKIKINIFILILFLLSGIITIIVSNKLYQILLNKKQALMLLEGYSYSEIYRVRILKTLSSYAVAILLFSTSESTVFKMNILIVPILIFLLLYLFDYYLDKYLFEKFTQKKILYILKGDS